MTEITAVFDIFRVSSEEKHDDRVYEILTYRLLTTLGDLMREDELTHVGR